MYIMLFFTTEVNTRPNREFECLWTWDAHFQQTSNPSNFSLDSRRQWLEFIRIRVRLAGGLLWSREVRLHIWRLSDGGRCH